MLPLILAIASRLGIPVARCPYCGERAATRWPWQAISSHVIRAH